MGDFEFTIAVVTEDMDTAKRGDVVFVFNGLGGHLLALGLLKLGSENLSSKQHREKLGQAVGALAEMIALIEQEDKLMEEPEGMVN